MLRECGGIINYNRKEICIIGNGIKKIVNKSGMFNSELNSNKLKPVCKQEQKSHAKFEFRDEIIPTKCQYHIFFQLRKAMQHFNLKYKLEVQTCY